MLWNAVLEHALTDLRSPAHKGDPRQKRNFREQVISWIGTRDFNEVCVLAGQDPGYLRDQFNRLVKERVWEPRQ